MVCVLVVFNRLLIYKEIICYIVFYDVVFIMKVLYLCLVLLNCR